VLTVPNYTTSKLHYLKTVTEFNILKLVPLGCNSSSVFCGSHC